MPNIWIDQNVETIYDTQGIVMATSWETDPDDEDMIAPCLIVRLDTGHYETYFTRDCRLTILDGEDKECQ
jgi:hypothetical protein